MTDKLKQAAEQYCVDTFGMYHPRSHHDDVLSFLAGASYQDPISRAEERAKILGLLANEYYQHRRDTEDNPSARMDADDWLDAYFKDSE